MCFAPVAELHFNWQGDQEIFKWLLHIFGLIKSEGAVPLSYVKLDFADSNRDLKEK